MGKRNSNYTKSNMGHWLVLHKAHRKLSNNSNDLHRLHNNQFPHLRCHGQKRLLVLSAVKEANLQKRTFCRNCKPVAEQVFNLAVDKVFLDLVAEGTNNSKVPVEEGVRVNDCLDNTFHSSSNSRLKIKVNVLRSIVLSRPHHLLLVDRVNSDVSPPNSNSSRVNCHDL